MKKKMFTLMFGLLLAVGWTSVASAQALPQGGYADRLGLTEVTASQVPNAMKMTAVSHEAAPATQSNGIKSNAPRRANNKPDVVYPKSYYDTLMYTWVDDNNVSHTDSATKLATDPNQIYQLLKFVYMDKRFPGPYYNAYTSTGEREDPVYYGGIEGGWNIPFTSTQGGGSTEPVTYTHEPITITTQSWNAYITSIRVVDAATEEVLTSWTQNTSGSQTLPSGWSSTATLTYYRWVL